MWLCIIQLSCESKCVLFKCVSAYVYSLLKQGLSSHSFYLRICLCIMTAPPRCPGSRITTVSARKAITTIPLALSGHFPHTHSHTSVSLSLLEGGRKRRCIWSLPENRPLCADGLKKEKRGSRLRNKTDTF